MACLQNYCDNAYKQGGKEKEHPETMLCQVSQLLELEMYEKHSRFTLINSISAKKLEK